jgi:hypothetical protein
MNNPTASFLFARIARCAGLLLGALILATCGFGAELTIDARTAPLPPAPLAFSVGGQSPDGHVFGANSHYLTLDGQPWFPVMGEFHYSRYPAAEWESEILKMKAGGIGVVATYVFWIHHEETEGKFDWSGQHDLRRFVELCAKHGLFAWVRIGPWCHGEARNGGFPDWLLQLGPPRTNSPAYLARVQRYFGEIGRQLQGLYWQDGGPIVGVQLENEYHPDSGGLEHMQKLRELAQAAGIVAPFLSATGWDRAVVPTTGFLPVFGGYTDNFWSNRLDELPPSQHFFFTAIRAEDNVMGDLTPKNAGYQSKYDNFPFLTAEMGGGMSIAYHRRPVMFAADSTAAALVKLGDGIAGLGYYMYHGGTNPDSLAPLQETQAGWNGYNDMEAKSYDFQAPLGEFGQVNPTYRTMRVLHLFLADFGRELAPMLAYFPTPLPKNRDDLTTPRAAARSDGQRAFVFINNYQRTRPLPDQRDFQVALQLPGGTVRIPRQPTTIPTGVYTHWPVNLDLGGVPLEYATAELVCRLAEPATFVFSAWPGLTPEFAFPASAAIEAPGARLVREGGHAYVDGVTPGPGVAIRVALPGGRQVQLVVLTREQALNLSKATLAGRERLVLSPADAYFDRAGIHLGSRDPQNLQAGVYPALGRIPAGCRDAGLDGVFQIYASTARFVETPCAVDVKPVKAAAPSVPVKVSAPPRAVAIEPDEADFDRAAVWRLRVPADALAGAPRTFLQIAYEGDVARVYAGGRFDNDNFYKGPPWELALWRYSAEELAQGLDLKILPLRSDAPIYLPPGARPGFPAGGGDVVHLKSVKVIREYQVVLPVAP